MLSPSIALITALVAGPQAAALVQAPPDDLSTLLDANRSAATIPALGAAVVRGDELIAIGVSGERAAKSGVPVTLDDRWHLGSCTKSMTATWVAMQVEREVTAWDSSVADVFGDRVGASDVHSGWTSATIEQLCQNRGGAPANLMADGLWAQLFSDRSPAPRAQRMRLVEGVLRRAPVAEPGTAFEYSNAGFSIAAAAIEKLIDSSYEERMRADLFEPLGMTSAGFGPPNSGDELEHPVGHSTILFGLRPARDVATNDNPAAIAPAGRVHATLADWARYASFHLAGFRGDTKFLSAESFERLHTPALDDYAMGWVRREIEGIESPLLWHNGSNTFWYAEILLIPSADIAVLVTSNVAPKRSQKTVEKVVEVLTRRYASPVGSSEVRGR